MVTQIAEMIVDMDGSQNIMTISENGYNPNQR